MSLTAEPDVPVVLAGAWPLERMGVGTMIGKTTRYGIGTPVRLSYDAALEATKQELAREGFGILTEIDVAATLKEKLGAAFRPYIILGACNPPLALRALQAERDIGLLLPCNVVVYAADVPGESVVAALDPVEALELTGNERIRPLAEEVRDRLEHVLERVAAVGSH